MESLLDTGERRMLHDEQPTSTTKTAMQYPAYVPAPDSLFTSWLDNFSALLTASPTTYGLIAGDAVAVAAVTATYDAAYALAVNPPTRTSGTIADKDAARFAAEALVRPLAVRIIRNPSVANIDRVNIGVTVPSSTPTPVPAPVTPPALILVGAGPLLHNLQYRDATAPLVKAKPFGVISLWLYAQLGTSAGIDPDAATFLGARNKTPLQVSWSSGDRGKHATYWARWATRSGPAGVPQLGPWSDSLDVIIL